MRGGIGTLQVNRPSPWGGALGALGEALNKSREEERQQKLQEEARRRQLNVSDMHSQILNRDVPVSDRQKMLYAMAEGRNDIDPNTLASYGQNFANESNQFDNLNRQSEANTILSQVLNKEIPIGDRKKILYAMAEGRTDVDPAVIRHFADVLDKEEQEQYKRNSVENKFDKQRNVLKSLGLSMGNKGPVGGFLENLNQEEEFDPEFAGKFVQDMMKPTPQRAITFNNSGAPASISAEDLMQAGLDEQEANTLSNLYNNAAPGGKNYIMKSLVEKMERSGFGQDQFQNNDGNIDTQESEGFQWPSIDNFKGLTGQERVKRQSELFKDNTKFSQEISGKKKSLGEEKRLISTLNQLNNRGNLPEGLGKLINTNLKTGQLTLTGVAHPDAQAYVKTVNSFLKNAKEIFGSRLTNFDVMMFMGMLPTLANDEAGRKLILKQMDSVNKLNNLYYDSLDKTYDKYGLQEINRQQVNTTAKQLRSEEEQALNDEYNNILSQSKSKVRPPPVEGKTPVISPDGKIGYSLNEKLEDLLKKGYKKL